MSSGLNEKEKEIIRLGRSLFKHLKENFPDQFTLKTDTNGKITEESIKDANALQSYTAVALTLKVMEAKQKTKAAHWKTDLNQVKSTALLDLQLLKDGFDAYNGFIREYFLQCVTQENSELSKPHFGNKLKRSLEAFLTESWRQFINGQSIVLPYQESKESDPEQTLVTSFFLFIQKTTNTTVSTKNAIEAYRKHGVKMWKIMYRVINLKLNWFDLYKQFIQKAISSKHENITNENKNQIIKKYSGNESKLAITLLAEFFTNHWV